MPLETTLDIWETTWRVPNAPLFVVGLAILGWALASGFLAFTGSQRSGQPEIHFPRQDAGVAEEPENAALGEEEQQTGA